MARSRIRHVLVVDDDAKILVAARRQLERDGRKAFTASNSKEAMRIADREKLELAIVDLVLDGESGMDLIWRLRGRYPALHIAMWTGYASLEVGFEAARAGVEAVLSKPTTTREVFAKLEQSPAIRIPRNVTLAEIKRDHVRRVLADANGSISEAARRLGIYRQALQRMLRSDRQ